MKRSEVDAKDVWKPEHMFASEEAWEAEYRNLAELATQIGAFEGKLNTAENVLECLELLDRIDAEAELLAVYASMVRDEDTRDERANARYNRIVTLLTSIGEKSAFVEPQIASNDDAALAAWEASPEFSDYDYFLARLRAEKPYVLSEKEERILALSQDFAGDFDTIFSMIDNADFEAPTIEADGKAVRVTHGTYSSLLQDPRQPIRKAAFDAYYGAYEKLKNTLAANYYANVKKNLFYSKARGYESYLDKCMRKEDVPESVYRTLIENVNRGLPVLHEYVAARKEWLGLDRLYMYDLYTPIVPNTEISVDYERACELVLEALRPMGDEYVREIANAMTGGWIDVYERDGKRSGGYCTHAYLAPHPYVLLNYSRTTHDVFTLAHELGHAMHSFYSSHAQPIAKADYRIFVAEVASTVNEMLLLESLLAGTDDPAMKKFLLAYRLDTIRTTIFRQTMFSEFELAAHEAVERGEPLTAEGLSDRYEELNRKYYGPAFEKDDHIRYEWMRIPHFYYSFYVYKYATGLTAALDIASRILDGEEGFAEKYRAFLSAGGSKSPYEILKDCGVDLATDAPYRNVLRIFEETLRELKSL